MVRPMGSDEAKTAVNGVVDPAADVTRSLKPTKAPETRDGTVSYGPTVATGIPAVSSNGSVASIAPVAGEPVDSTRTVATPLEPGPGGDPDRTPPKDLESPDGDTTPGAAVGEHRSPVDTDSPDQTEYSEVGEPEADDEHWIEEYRDAALFSSIFSAPSLALAGFAFALTGLLGGMIPESLPYLIQIDPSQGPEFHVRLVGVIALGFAIIAASLGLAAMLRSIGSPLRWPRYLGGAAVLLALLIALQAVLLISLAGMPGPPGLD